MDDQRYEKIEGDIGMNEKKENEVAKLENLIVEVRKMVSFFYSGCGGTAWSGYHRFRLEKERKKLQTVIGPVAIALKEYEVKVMEKFLEEAKKGIGN